MVYALIGVPLMLVCLSQMGSLLAEAIQSLYAFIHCCGHKPPHGEYQLEERGGARSTLVVGMGSGGRAVCKLTSVESSLSDYPSNSGHSHESDDEETDVTSSGALNETPSRIPLIWRGSSSERPGTPPPVPAVLPLALLCSYLAAGAYLWAKWQSASYLDGLYFAFTALATIGLADLDHRHPPAGPRTAQDQLQLLALAAYLLFGLVLVATAFALVQEQVIAKTRQIATSLGVVKKDTLPI
ncbi:hypothetical protein AAG570_010805 [Ranatra chinensis]|uniref:Potassium channel domain-containing protein n=1 Tax=Ranatra chinensis TaxID=642074 RepID=A0ABD0Z5N8_9HEMI